MLVKGMGVFSLLEKDWRTLQTVFYVLLSTCAIWGEVCQQAHNLIQRVTWTSPGLLGIINGLCGSSHGRAYCRNLFAGGSDPCSQDRLLFEHCGRRPIAKTTVAARRAGLSGNTHTKDTAQQQP